MDFTTGRQLLQRIHCFGRTPLVFNGFQIEASDLASAVDLSGALAVLFHRSPVGVPGPSVNFGEPSMNPREIRRFRSGFPIELKCSLWMLFLQFESGHQGTPLG